MSYSACKAESVQLCFSEKPMYICPSNHISLCQALLNMHGQEIWILYSGLQLNTLFTVRNCLSKLHKLFKYVQLLAETNLTASQRDLVNTIRCSGETLLILITDILDFSRIEANKMVLSLHHFKLRSVVEAAMEIAGLSAAQKRLQVQLSSRLAHRVYARLRESCISLVMKMICSVIGFRTRHNRRVNAVIVAGDV